jgi:hypothetical protein
MAEPGSRLDGSLEGEVPGAGSIDTAAVSTRPHPAAAVPAATRRLRG